MGEMAGSTAKGSFLSKLHHTHIYIYEHGNRISQNLEVNSEERRPINRAPYFNRCDIRWMQGPDSHFSEQIKGQSRVVVLSEEVHR
jgi:hypothetical protein